MDANDVRGIALDLIFQEVLYGLDSKDAERYCAYEAGVHDMGAEIIKEMEKHDGETREIGRHEREDQM